MPARAWLWPVLLALLGCDAREPGPAAARAARTTREPLVSDAECVECHEDAARGWARSRHHAAFRNPDFQRAYAREPKPFCRDCHAPGLTRDRPLPGHEAEDLGVGCKDCHAEGEVVVTDAERHGRPAPAAPHALELRVGFATQSCARCHEFEFPPTSRRAGSLMQSTHREHAASPYAARSCASCHLPAGDHSLASTRDPAAWRRSLHVTAAREGDVLHLALTPHAVGHTLPTGDLYRRLAVHAERWLDGRVIARVTRYLDREFVPYRDRKGRIDPRYHQPLVDDRLTGPTTLTLDLGLEPGQPGGGALRWWIDYERVDARDDHDPAASSLASAERIAEGTLDEPRPRPLH